MSSSAGQPVILYHKCLSRPFIRGFGQLGAGTRRDTRLPEEGDGGTSTEIVGSFPNTRSPGRLQSRRHSGERDARRSIVLPTYGWGAAVISKRHKKEKKKAKAGKVTASRLCTGQGPGCPRATFLFRVGISHLPDADDGVGDQDEQNDERLHEGGDRVVVVLEEGQHLKWEDGQAIKDGNSQADVFLARCHDQSVELHLMTFDLRMR